MMEMLNDGMERLDNLWLLLMMQLLTIRECGIYQNHGDIKFQQFNILALNIFHEIIYRQDYTKT